MPRRIEALNHSRNRRRKARLKSLLLKRDTTAVLEWAADGRNAFRTLQSLLWDADLLVVWRSIEALGEVSSVRAAQQLDEVREVVRKLLWCMNDESGNLCWFAAEAIAEILTKVPSLRDEYLTVWLSFLDEEPFEAGVRWGISRLVAAGGLTDDELQTLLDYRFDLVESLSHAKAPIRATAILALTALGETIPAGMRSDLSNDTTSINVYEARTGELRLVRINSLLPSQTQ